MNIFKMHSGYRKLGINYGLQVFYIDCGLGITLDAVKGIEKLIGMGLNINRWVVIRRNPLKEKDTRSFIEGLKTCKVSVELEENGLTKDPMWFPIVDRWVVEWTEQALFNYGAMRPGRDIILFKSGDLGKFLTKDFQGIKAILGSQKEMEKIAKDFPVRVYNKEEDATTW